MQGSNNDSKVGMSNSRKSWDDSSWGYGTKNSRGSKGRNSKNQQVRQKRRTGDKRNQDYADSY